MCQHTESFYAAMEAAPEEWKALFYNTPEGSCYEKALLVRNNFKLSPEDQVSMDGAVSVKKTAPEVYAAAELKADELFFAATQTKGATAKSVQPAMTTYQATIADAVALRDTTLSLAQHTIDKIGSLRNAAVNSALVDAKRARGIITGTIKHIDGDKPDKPTQKWNGTDDMSYKTTGVGQTTYRADDKLFSFVGVDGKSGTFSSGGRVNTTYGFAGIAFVAHKLVKDGKPFEEAFAQAFALKDASSILREYPESKSAGTSVDFSTPQVVR